jgi:hypothetical protein
MSGSFLYYASLVESNCQNRTTAEAALVRFYTRVGSTRVIGLFCGRFVCGGCALLSLYMSRQGLQMMWMKLGTGIPPSNLRHGECTTRKIQDDIEWHMEEWSLGLGQFAIFCNSYLIYVQRNVSPSFLRSWLFLLISSWYVVQDQCNVRPLLQRSFRGR